MKSFPHQILKRTGLSLNLAAAASQRGAFAPRGYAASVAFASRSTTFCAALAFCGLLSVSQLNAQSPAPAPAVAADPTPPADSRPETVISSDELDMVGGDEANHFYFRGNVKVQATNMIATADELEVISARQSAKGGASKSGDSSAAAASSGQPQRSASADSSSPDIGSIREIIMRGNVVISQEGRRATAGIAYLYPQEGRVVLADNPKVTDAQGTLSGWRMELYRGERKVRILSNPDEKQRTRVTLPALQDLGYNELGEPATTAPAEGAAAGNVGQGAQSGGAAAEGATSDSAATTTSAASGSSSSAAPATGAAAPAATEAEAAEPPARTSSGGWNPVNSRRR